MRDYPQEMIDAVAGCFAPGYAPHETKIVRILAAIEPFFRPAMPDAQSEQTAAAQDVLAERRRQIEVEGWTAEHDDQHANGEMAQAAASYALASFAAEQSLALMVVDLWPWSYDWFKPTTERACLIKAGALIIAEIERLDRAALAKAEGRS